jgi:hypothetical protein
MRNGLYTVLAAACAADPADPDQPSETPSRSDSEVTEECSTLGILSIESAESTSVAEELSISYAFPVPEARVAMKVEAPGTAVALRLSLVDEVSGEVVAATLGEFVFTALHAWDEPSCSGWTTQYLSVCAEWDMPYCGDDESCALDGRPVRVDVWLLDIAAVPPVEDLGGPTGTAWFTAKVDLSGC